MAWTGWYPEPKHWDENGDPKGELCPYCEEENHFHSHEVLKEHLLEFRRNKINEGLQYVAEPEKIRGKPERWLAGYIASMISGLTK